MVRQTWQATLLANNIVVTGWLCCHFRRSRACLAAFAAAGLFTHPEWQAAAHYRAGDFDQAVHNLNGINSSDAHYNRGNI